MHACIHTRVHANSCAYAWALTYTLIHVHACVHVRIHTHKCRLTPRTCCTLANNGLMQKGFGLEKQPNFTQVCARERDLSAFTSLSRVFSLRCLCPHPAQTNSTGGTGRPRCSCPSKKTLIECMHVQEALANTIAHPLASMLPSSRTHQKTSFTRYVFGGGGGTRGDESVDGHALACISSQAHRPPRTHILLGYVQAMLNVQLSEGPVPSAHRARQLLWLYLVCSHGQ